MVDKYKYKMSFGGVFQPLVSSEVDKYLAIASKNNLKQYLPPNIDFDKRIDFLGFCGEAFIANKLNLNGDGVESKDAVALAKMAPYTFLDLNHKRNLLLGTIVNASLTEIGSNKILTEEEALKTTSPFSVVIGGVIWRLVNKEISEKLEEAGSPLSDLYNHAFISWEIALNEINLIRLDAKKYNFEDGQIITDAAEITKLEPYLRANGGTGVDSDGKKIGRIATGNQLLLLGAGIVTDPAGQVKPIFINSDIKKVELSDDKKEENTASIKNNDKNEKIISHSENDVVKATRMKITQIKDITDESLKQISASDISTFVNDELQKVSESYKKEQEAKAVALAKVSELSTEMENTKKQLATIKANLEVLEQEKAAKAKQELFDSRMLAFNETFELSDEDRQVIASQIKDLDNDNFVKYEKSMATLLKEKNKKEIEAKKKAAKDADDKKAKDAQDAKDKMDDKADGKDAKASKEAQASVDSALNNGTEKKDMPNAGSVTQTLKDKFAKAFALDQFNIVTRK